MASRYRVVVKRWAEGWELHVDEVGVTQARWPSEAERMVRDLIAQSDNPPDMPFDLEWIADSDESDFLAAVA